VALIRELGATCVAGNHDLIATGRLSDEGIGALARETLRWTAQALDGSTRAFLAGLPLEARADGVLVTHGALGDPRTKVRTRRQAAGQLAAMAALDPELRILVLGHTHRAAAYAQRRGIVLACGTGTIAVGAADRHLLNPGAVGQARERTLAARCLVLDLDARQAAFHTVDYDHRVCERALRERGLPTDTYHLRPTPMHRRARRYVRRVIRDLRAGRRPRQRSRP
jgi:predicted phosphodiesterase